MLFSGPSWLHLADDGSNILHLYGFSQAHFVSEDPVEFSFVQRDEPIETDVLILAKSSSQQERDLRFDAGRVLEGSIGRSRDASLISFNPS